MTSRLEQANNNNSIGRTAILVLIYFFYLYSFELPGVGIGTVLAVLGILACYTAYAFIRGYIKRDSLRTNRMVRSYCLWNIFLLIYVFILIQAIGEGNGTTPFKDYIQMLIILPLFYISGKVIFRNTEELMKVLYIGVIIQSFIIIAALLIPALSVALFLLIPEGGFNSEHFGGINMITEHGYHIGLGVFTSGGSIKMAIGQIGACYYLIKSQRMKLFIHLVIFLLIAVATSVVSRTGLLISIIGLLVVFYAKSKQTGHKALGLGFRLIVALAIGYSVLVVALPSDFYEDTFKRIIDLSERGARDTYFAGYSGEYGDNVIPPLSSETLIGLGITYGVAGNGIATYTDGGFMRNYSAMGLIVAIVNYIIIASFFLKQYKKSKAFDNKSIIILMFLFLLIGEFKECCVYYIYPMCFIFLIFSLLERSERSEYSGHFGSLIS